MSSTTSAAPGRRQLIGRLILLVGLGLASLPVLARVPREQTLVFRLNDRSVTRLEASFTPVGETAPLGAVTLRFPDRAPRSVRHQVTLPNGDYTIAVELESTEHSGAELAPPAPRASGRGASDSEPSTGSESTRETSSVRRVSLQGGETVIPL